MKRILPFALGLAIIAVASVQGYAFMAATNEVASETEIDVVKLVEDVRTEVVKQDIDCSAKLATIEEALEQIDAILDAGTADEDTLLDARDALVQLRLSLDCPTQTQLAGNENIISDKVIGERVVNMGTTPSAGYTSGGYSGGMTSGGGSAAAGGGGRLGLLAAAGAAAVIIPVATSSDDDAPAVSASN